MPPFNRVSSIEALTALYGETTPASLRKEVTRLTAPYRKWIEASPFLAIATSGPGGLDCSPRGDREGRLFAVLDETTIAIPDRRGNNRLDTLRNLMVDPRVALLFLVPGIAECVRINGRAIVTDDPILRGRFTVEGKLPTTVIVVTIAAVYFQCARAIMRSSLWDPAIQIPPGTLPSAGEMTRSGDPAFDAETYDAALRPRQKSTLY